MARGLRIAFPLPDFVPAAGMIANMPQLNSLADVDPCPARDCAYSPAEGQQGIFSYSGGAYNEHRGTYGSYILHGGGHNAYYGDEVYEFVFDDETLQELTPGAAPSDCSMKWRRLKNPWTGIVPGTSTTNAFGEYDDNPFSPVDNHPVQHGQYQSPELGGGSEGSYLLLNIVSGSKEGNVYSGWAHRFDFAAREWSRVGSNAGQIAASASQNQSATCFDSNRNVYWKVCASRVSKFDPAASGGLGEWTDYTVSNGATFSVSSVCAFHPGFDRIVLFNFEGSFSDTFRTIALHSLDVSTLGSSPAWAAHTQSDVPTCGGVPGDATSEAAQLFISFSVDWSPLLGKFGCYAAGGFNILHYLTPPGTVNGTWAWSTETFGGDTPHWSFQSGGGSGSRTIRLLFNRMRWAEALRCFAWAEHRTKPIQLWRPAGT